MSDVRLSRDNRRRLLTAHIAASVGWLGVAYAMLVMTITADRSADLATRQGAYALMSTLDLAAVLPLGLLALATGVILGVGTHWGLVKHWWVAVKLFLNLAALVIPMLTRHPALADALAAARAGLLTDPARQVLDASIASVVVLTTATVLSVYKPWGRTGAPI
ncbi:DUF2269 family protein [Catellatospora sp. KI3]|uniref:DUF2269 family protein n=1 Tax=Catellatospora sp. KI3 TaxID=3041620 RepID=UPI0024829D24|nr:DUF2269 family protein [Catellatospora sp. KI3]MDI1462785.1 DUF2269 family protein [Catellatospora sp. KI3]